MVNRRHVATKNKCLRKERSIIRAYFRFLNIAKCYWGNDRAIHRLHVDLSIYLSDPAKTLVNRVLRRIVSFFLLAYQEFSPFIYSSCRAEITYFLQKESNKFPFHVCVSVLPPLPSVCPKFEMVLRKWRWEKQIWLALESWLTATLTISRNGIAHYQYDPHRIRHTREVERFYK